MAFLLICKYVGLYALHPLLQYSLSPSFPPSLSQIQNGRFKTGMCPYLPKPGGCPKGERCTYAHSEEERDRFRNLAKPVKPTKPRSGEQYSRGSVGGRRSGDHGPIKAHTDTHPSATALGSYEFLSGSAPDPQHFDHIRYSGKIQD